MTADSSPEFGTLLRRHRLAAGLSQEQLAERAGVSARAVSDLERGRRLAPYPHTVHQLAAALGLGAAERARLEASVPPRRVATAPERGGAGPATNLPLALTSFVGRERELAEVRRLLGETRLLTLTGAGGVGKTRLALEVARAVAPDYPDGVWVVELAAQADPTLVPQVVAAGLGIPEQPGRPVAEVLTSALVTRRLLLVLDNCEHLLDACAVLADALLRACPGVRVLATSRAPLGVAGETAWRVPSLAVPPRDGGSLRAGLGQVESVALFVARAAAARPGFALTQANAVAVAEICRRLDGIPLALELAAAWVLTLPPAQLAARLDDGLRVLAHGGQTAPPRHRTMEATIEWSHALLAGPERVLFRRLAVFAGGWGLEAAEAVGAGDGIGRAEILGRLRRLVEVSLVQVEDDGQEARYRLLETVRQYAGERLVEAGEEAAARGWHRDWCLALAERAEPALHRRRQLAWLNRLETEHDNLRAALAWCLEADEPGGPDDIATSTEAGLRLAGAIWWFWFLRVHWREAVTSIDRLGARGQVATAVRAKALCGAGIIWYIHLGDVARGLALLDESVALYRMGGDKSGLSRALAELSHFQRLSGLNYASATARFEEALALARATGDPWLIARVMLLDANSADQTRDDEVCRTQAVVEEALRCFQVTDDTLGVAIAYRVLGRLAVRQGDYERAQASFEADLTRTRALGDRGGVGGGLRALAQVAVATGRPARAARLYGAADGLLQDVSKSLVPVERLRHAEAIRAAHMALGDVAFTDAWSAGQALTLDEAIAEALAGDGAGPTAASPTPPPRPTPPLGLTAREVEVLRLVAEGLSDARIAARLFVSRHTVNGHLKAIYSKLGVTSRTAAARLALDHGLR